MWCTAQRKGRPTWLLRYVSRYGGMFFGPNFFGKDPQFLDLVLKIAPISDHVAKFRGNRPRDCGDLVLNKKRKTRCGAQHNVRQRWNRVSGSRVTGSAIWVRVGSGHGSKPRPGFLTRILVQCCEKL